MNLPCHQPQSIYRYRSYLQHVLPPLHSSLLQGGLLAGRACRVENTLSAAKVSHQVSPTHPPSCRRYAGPALVRQILRTPACAICQIPLISHNHATTTGPEPAVSRKGVFVARVVRANFSFPSQPVAVICTTEMLPCARSIIAKADHGSSAAWTWSGLRGPQCTAHACSWTGEISDCGGLVLRSVVAVELPKS
jgi:hypothetical protein